MNSFELRWDQAAARAFRLRLHVYPHSGASPAGMWNGSKWKTSASFLPNKYRKKIINCESKCNPIPRLQQQLNFQNISALDHKAARVSLTNRRNPIPEFPSWAQAGRLDFTADLIEAKQDGFGIFHISFFSFIAKEIKMKRVENMLSPFLPPVWGQRLLCVCLWKAKTSLALNSWLIPPAAGRADVYSAAGVNMNRLTLYYMSLWTYVSSEVLSK